jgi:endonuclease/exonuclease/phosphatase family metal-dependent hydrolase
MLRPSLRGIAVVAALAALVVTGCRSTATVWSPAAAAPPPRLPDGGDVRVLTLNVWSGLDYKGLLSMGRLPDAPADRYERLVAGLREMSPDIVAIQEANPLPGYARRLAEDLGYEVAYSVALGGIRAGPVGIPWNLREGNAVLVRKPWTIAETRAYRLGGWGLTSNWLCLQFVEVTQVLYCRIEAGGQPLHVYNVHLRSAPFRGPDTRHALDGLTAGDAERARQEWDADLARRQHEIRRLGQYIAETLPPGDRAVLLGDFNTAPESGELHSLLAQGEWLDTFRAADGRAEGATWAPDRNPHGAHRGSTTDPYSMLRAAHESKAHRIDLVLAREFPPKGVVSSRLAFTPETEGCVSDHFGVLTVVRP